MQVTSRRNFLRFAAATAVGLGIFLASDGLISTESFRKNTQSLAGSPVGSSVVTESRASLITVKVYYFMMTQYINLSEEEFVLQSPATIQTLIDTCILRHPAVAQMMGTMMILLDGVPSQSTASLNDGEAVQFIPLSAGG
jgi:molybdopterin converting factor small subunit